jgi:hypothetical protein
VVERKFHAGINFGFPSLLAILCGVMAPMINYPIAFGQAIAQQASHVGNTALLSGYAVWPIGLGGGHPPNIAYGLHLLKKNKSRKFCSCLAS